MFLGRAKRPVHPDLGTVLLSDRRDAPHHFSQDQPGDASVGKSTRGYAAERGGKENKRRRVVGR